MEYIAVVEEEGAEPVEIELEENLSVGLATLAAEFGAGIAGLSYRNPASGLRRMLRVDGSSVSSPRSGWLPAVKYVIVRAKQPTCTSEDAVKVKEMVAVTEKAPHLVCARTDVKKEKAAGTAVSSGKKVIKKTTLLRMQGKSAIARNAIHSWNKLNTTIRRLVQATQWEGTAGMTKCEGTTKAQALENREKREALVNDRRVQEHFCQYCIECEDGDGVVYNYAVDHVRHCLNSMKKSGTFSTELKVEVDENLSDKENNVTGEQEEMKVHRPRTSTPKRKKRKFEEDLSMEKIESGEDYLVKRAQNIEENKQFMFELGMPSLKDEDFHVVGKAWFPPEVACRLTMKKVLKEMTAFGIPKPKRCSLKDALKLLAKELLIADRVTLRKKANLTRSDIICY